MKHTPGPWKADRMYHGPKEKDRRCGFIVNGPDENQQDLPLRICDLRVPSGMDGFREGQANARLIAAAPELLEALREVVSISDRKHNAWDKARSAIAKAEGRE